MYLEDSKKSQHFKRLFILSIKPGILYCELSVYLDVPHISLPSVVYQPRACENRSSVYIMYSPAAISLPHLNHCQILSIRNLQPYMAGFSFLHTNSHKREICKEVKYQPTKNQCSLCHP